MTGSAAVWIVAIIELLGAAGFVAYWTMWLREDHDETRLPAGYLDHERAFLVTDSVIVLLLTGGAVMQLLERPAGDSVGLVTGGMLLFLGLIDAAYFARTGMFERERDGLLNLGVVVGVLLLATILIGRFF